MFSDQGQVGEFVGEGGKLVYEFVRKELGILLNRGVEDYLLLLLRIRVEGENDYGYGNGIQVDLRIKILGIQVFNIYEVLWKGVLYDCIMKYVEEVCLWV